MKKELIPEVGKTYVAYNDGKISKSRAYNVKISKVIPFDKIDKNTKERWQKEKVRCPWIFNDKTDYFIFAEPNDENVIEIWVRTKDNTWFSFSDGFLTYSLLDVEDKYYEEQRLEILRLKKEYNF